MTDVRDKIGNIRQTILGLEPSITRSIDLYRKRIKDFESQHPENVTLYPATYWKDVMYVDALVKLRVFIETNFSVFETMGVLALARYVLELTVWVKLLGLDERYGLLYYRMLLKESQDYHEKLAAQCEREIALLKKLDSQETEALARLRKSNNGVSADDSWVLSDAIDQEAAELFSLYADDAKTRGYGFQAHLVERQPLQTARQTAAEISGLISEFDKDCPVNITDLRKERWNWEKAARSVGMIEEYDFVYSYTSRLLHAKPSSLATDQKSLEESEMYLFLRYMCVKMVEIGRITHGYLGVVDKALH